MKKTFSLSTYLLAIAAVATVPILIFSALAVDRLVQAKREATELLLVKTADELARGFDQEVVATILTLKALSQATSLYRNDLENFHSTVSRALKTQKTWGSIQLHSPDGKWILNARLPYGIDPGPTLEKESILAAAKSGEPVVGKIIPIPSRSAIGAGLGYAIRVPVKDDHGKVKYILSSTMRVDHLQELINRYSAAPNEWVRALVDKDVTLGGRSRDPQKFVGKSASGTVVDLIKRKAKGVYRTVTLDGVQVYTATSVAPVSGWASAVAVPAAAFEAAARETRNWILFFGLAAILISTLITLLVSRWIKRALVDASVGAASLARGEIPAMKPSQIKEIQELRKSLLSASELLRSREKAKSEFLANMSHELRTPMGIVLGTTDLLATDSMSNEERSRSWEIVKRNARQLLRLIDDILDLSKIEANRMQMEFVDFSLPDLIGSVVQDFSTRAEEKAITLSFRVDDNAPEIINSDPVRVRQIVFNIVGNAVKFTQQGSIKVQLLNTKSDLIKIIVTDSGIGISEQQRKLLFNEFTQGDSSHTRKFGGTGLGLSLSRKLARLLEGEVKLTESAVGAGSTFEITFKAKPPTGRLLVKTTPQKSPSTQPTSSLKDYRILLAEDSADNVTLIKHFLKPSGIGIDVATTGAEAYKLASATKYDLILMDIQMPDMDGYEATRKLRSDGNLSPIVALTAHALKEQRDFALDNGFNDYLTKPIDRALLLKSVTSLIERRPT